jgi:hypothetical protein
VRPARRLGLELLEHRLAPATLTVDSTQDTANPSDPWLSLREAISIVNSPTLPDGLSDQILAQISGGLHDGGNDTIGFDPAAVTGPITLAGTQLELTLPASTAAVTIDGGAGGVTVDGNNASRVFQVDAGVQATLDHLTITHGQVTFPVNGGGLSNNGTLTMSHCTLEANSASSGGGISNGGTLTVTDSILSANSASANGGGISNEGTLTVTNSTISSNSAFFGGGIVNPLGGTLSISNSVINSNTAGANGGGIFIGDGTLTVTVSTISANTASSGGGIYNGNGTLTVSNSLIDSNTASVYGGGILNDFGTLTVNNSTISANSTAGEGGGILNGLAGSPGRVTVSNSTLSVNSASRGGGIYNDSRGTLSLQNTIVAGNPFSSADSGPDINGAVDGSSRYNLVGIGDSTLTGISDGSQGNQIGSPASPIDPLLAPLGDYGGPTQTMPLLPGSAALNAGDPDQAGSPDQRGVVRSGGVNIGAFQASAASFVLTAPDTATPGVAFDVSVAVVDIFGQRAVGYTGTIHFSTSDPDPGVVLPPDTTLGLSNGGMIDFSAGVTLFSAGEQTLSVTDLGSGITGSTSVTL